MMNAANLNKQQHGGIFHFTRLLSYEYWDTNVLTRNTNIHDTNNYTQELFFAGMYKYNHSNITNNHINYINIHDHYKLINLQNFRTI